MEQKAALRRAQIELQEAQAMLKERDREAAALREGVLVRDSAILQLREAKEAVSWERGGRWRCFFLCVWWWWGGRAGGGGGDWGACWCGTLPACS